MGWFDLSPEELTEGPITPPLLVLAAPILLQNMVRVAQQVIDLFWVGHYSSEAVAAIGLAFPVVAFLLVSSISASSLGTQVLVSQRVGADNTRGARSAVFTGLWVTTVLCVGIGITVFHTGGVLLDLITSTRPTTAGSNVLQFATTYLQVIALGIVFAGLSSVIEAGFIGWGDSRATLYMNVVSVVTNVSLDPVLIFGVGPIPAMGIRGAALATVAGYASGLLIGLALVTRGRSGGICSRATARIDFGECRELLDIGLPRAVQGAASTISSLFLVLVVFSAAGASGLAAYTVVKRVGSLASRVVISLHQAAQSIVGQNLGAGNPRRAARTTWIGVGIAAGTLAVIGIAQLLVPGFITHLFVPELDGRSFTLAVTGLQIFAIGYPAYAIFSLIQAGFNGARRTKTTMIASLIQTWLLQLPIAVVGGIVFGFGAIGVFWAQPLSIIVATVSLVGYYRYTTNDGMYVCAARRIDTTPSD